MQLLEAQLAGVREQLVDPVARRVELEPVAGVGGDERAPAAVLLHAQPALGRPLEHLVELVVVERHPEMVDPRQRPLARLDDDVDRAALELGEPEPEALCSSSSHETPASNEHLVLADPPVARDQLEAELAEVARLDLADVARHEVVVEQLHCARFCRKSAEHARSVTVGTSNGSALHHVDLVVSSIERSLPFYRDLLAPLGCHRIGEVEGERGETIWYLSGAGGSIGLREAQTPSGAYDRYRVGLHHLALEAASRAVVDERADWLRGQGAEIESGPEEYSYIPGYYAVFFYDPDGIKLEIVHVPGLAA